MQLTKEQQHFFMRWAIRLGEKGRLSAPPNPWVGCVIVKEGEILGEGYHALPGNPHAEIMALEKAGNLARGATAYVSLEPCAHYGRTGPCTDALIAAGIKQVVIPFLDPDPNVSGKGVAALKEAGIDVVIGVAKEDAYSSLEPYLYHRKTKKPFCILKSAMSIDGKIAAQDGSSKWITGEEARHNVHLLRAESQAILIGATTALIDHPHLTVRGVEAKQPLRVLLDPNGKVPPEGPLFDPTHAPTLVFTKHVLEWKKQGIEVAEYISLRNVLFELGKRDILQLLVEGGAHTHSAFIKEGLAQKFVVYIGACVLGVGGKAFLSEVFIPSISEAPRWNLENMSRFGNDVRLDYRIHHEET